MIKHPEPKIDTARRYFHDRYQQLDQPPGPVDITEITATNHQARHYYERLQETIQRYDLQHAKALEIGAGVGMLQSFVADYTGLDIAASCDTFLVKPFVVGSATALPFDTATFDLVWSIWVLEHIADPQAMLHEVRRVLKPGGLFFLCAAWDVPPWIAQGCHVRPFHALTWQEKLVKISLVWRTTYLYRLIITLLQRIIRQVYVWITSDQQLAFRRLEPNFQTYWSSDSDACIAIDSHAVWLWMTAQGDTCVGVTNPLQVILTRHTEPLIFRVKPHKRAAHAG